MYLLLLNQVQRCFLDGSFLFFTFLLNANFFHVLPYYQICYPMKCNLHKSHIIIMVMLSQISWHDGDNIKSFVSMNLCVFFFFLHFSYIYVCLHEFQVEKKQLRSMLLCGFQIQRQLFACIARRHSLLS